VGEELVHATTTAEEFVAAHSGKVHLPIPSNPNSGTANNSRQPTILVTGASGFVGRALVERLTQAHFRVRALVRPLSNVATLKSLGVELFYGDIRDREALRDAARGSDALLHLAAGVRGSREFVYESCLKGTLNVASVAEQLAIRRVVYVSSMTVYDFWALPEGGEISCEAPLEEQPALRGAYSIGKRAAEDVALSQLSKLRPAWTIVRPSVIFGPNVSAWSIAGFKLGPVLLAFGRKRKILRLIHVHDVSDILLRILTDPTTEGKILNVSHPEEISTQEHVERFLKPLCQRLLVIYLPYKLLVFPVWIAESLFRGIKKFPVINRRRFAYLCRSLHVTNDCARLNLWSPGQSLVEQLDRELAK